ncbi:MAG: cytochrome c-type biogenesis protein CcmH [Actinomycetota bacterium]|nr:cytochrome c-type biogenesis protein CcmH [Actinomycetota bacterium]
MSLRLRGLLRTGILVLATATPTATATATATATFSPTAPATFSPAATAATPPRASLPDIENEVMCTLCHESLAVAQSPEADAERNFISSLIGRGETKPQIERALVAQYGPSVLALPPARGFNLTLYIVPPALLIAALAALGITLPRWRRRARAAATRPASAGKSPSAADATLLESDLARFDG